jgi:hypothetical protein
MSVFDTIYHASSVRGLKRIVPSESTHGNWVHAVGDAVLAACFLSTLGGDLTCAVGRDPKTGAPYLCERFEGAFESRFANRTGSIYVMDGATFLAGHTPWEEEVVSPEPVVVRDEIPIDDVARHLLALAEEGRLLIVRYPERIGGIPPDDSDLIARAVVWQQRFGDDIVGRFATYHPQLLPRIRRALDRRTSASEHSRSRGEPE